jgi:puromycin-sensitive aminopeptidase
MRRPFIVRTGLSVLLLLVTAWPGAAQRLPTNATPEHYSLWFAPDFTKDNFRGTASIRVRLKTPSAAITLNAAEIEFGTVTIAAGGATQTAKVSLDEKTEMATLTVPKAIPAGAATIDIAFVGMLNDKLRGFYLSTLNGRKYAVTQMEATDARRAFPCFDEPAFKATFDISLTVDKNDTVISNGSILSETPGPGAGKRTVKFSRTPRMSTYLVAMLVGDFACREGGVGDIPVRVCSTPDKKALTGFALEAAEHALKFYNDYFGIKYPFGKMDIIGIPDFSAGAMENAGAITFRERSLLADPARASVSVKKGVAAVIAHEIAHQWFGNLVTMKWWDDIWLNEGFATWLENKPLAEWKPEWNMHLTDLQDTRKALATDALRSTRSIRHKVDTTDQINEVFDAIAYEKTGGVIRMMEHYVGKEAFRAGIQSYLRKFAYSNAAGEDFWNELARATGKPIDRIMPSYVLQPGAPVLSVSTSCRGGSTNVAIQQRRFAGATEAPKAAQTWTVPVCAKSAKGAAVCKVISQPKETLVVPGCGAPVFINKDSLGYFYTEYTPEDARALAKTAGALTTAERLGLLSDEWQIARAGGRNLDVYLDLAAAFSGDTSAEITGEITGRLAYVGDYLVRPADRDRYRAWIRSTFGPVLDKLGIPGPLTDSEEQQLRRAALIGLLGGAGDSPEVQRRARELAMDYLANPARLPGTLVSTILRTAALGGDTALYERYKARMQQVTADPEEFYRFFNALTSFRDPALMTRTLEFALSDDVRSQDTAALFQGVMERQPGRDLGWTFMKANWERIVKKLGSFQSLPGVIGALGSACSSSTAADAREFFKQHPVPAAERTIAQTLERIDNCAALETRQSPVVSAWLARR